MKLAAHQTWSALCHTLSVRTLTHFVKIQQLDKTSFLVWIGLVWQSFITPQGPSSSRCRDLGKWAAQCSWVPCHCPKLLVHVASAGVQVSAPTLAQEGCRQGASSWASHANPSLSRVPIVHWPVRDPHSLSDTMNQSKQELSYSHYTGQPALFWPKRPGDSLWSIQQRWCCAKEASVVRQLVASPAITTWDVCLQPSWAQEGLCQQRWENNNLQRCGL